MQNPAHLEATLIRLVGYWRENMEKKNARRTVYLFTCLLTTWAITDQRAVFFQPHYQTQYLEHYRVSKVKLKHDNTVRERAENYLIYSSIQKN